MINQRLAISVKTTNQDGQSYDFSYYFDYNMNILFIKSSNNVDAFHKKLVDEHKLTGIIDDAYLEKLRNGVSLLEWEGMAEGSCKGTTHTNQSLISPAFSPFSPVETLHVTSLPASISFRFPPPEFL